MPASLVEGNSLLAVDIGAVSTRAAYFDVVEGRYRHIASGQAGSTATAPWQDVALGIREAIADLQGLLGKPLLDDDGRLIMPSHAEFGGVDGFVASLSAGPAIKTLVVGLLSEVSLESAQRLARSTYSRVVETIGMNDRRAADQQVDLIARLSPELILIAGGTENGASRSLQNMIETIGLACYLLPEERRPAILYAGNKELAEDAKASLERLSSGMLLSPNIRPSLDLEDLEPARKDLAALYPQIRKKQVGGVQEMTVSAAGPPLPTAFAQGRIIRFLSTVSERGILGVDVGASATTILAGHQGNLSTSIFPQFGLGESLGGILRHTSLAEISQWLSIDISEDALRDYLYLKALHPGSIPATAEDLAIERALARSVLGLALRAARQDFPRLDAVRPGLLPVFDPIIAAGSVFTGAPRPGQSLLMLLDTLQPAGFCNLLLDQNNLMPAMGAAAELNPLLPVHVIEAGAFMPLASVVTPLSGAAAGSPILRVQLTGSDGSETKVEITQGSIEVLPLPTGRTAELRLQPVGRTNAGFGAGRGYRVEAVNGSALGVVIDARGRPLRLSDDPARRRELHQQWLQAVGG